MQVGPLEIASILPVSYPPPPPPAGWTQDQRTVSLNDYVEQRPAHHRQHLQALQPCEL